MDVGGCGLYRDLVTAAWDSENGVRWDHLPSRAHAGRNALALYDLRCLYAVDAVCPDDRDAAHISRRPVE